MSEFFKTSVTWVVDFRFDGKPRRWFKAFGARDDVRQAMVCELEALYGERAQLVAVRHATEDEETQYLRGEEPKNVLCPTGRHAQGAGRAPSDSVQSTRCVDEGPGPKPCLTPVAPQPGDDPGTPGHLHRNP